MVRPGDIDFEAEQAADREAALPRQFCYLTWVECEHVHVSNDRKIGLCGVAAPDLSTVMVMGVPMGKPRCRECLKAAGLPDRKVEPNPFHGFEAIHQRESAPTQDMPKPPAQPTMSPEFFRGQKLPDDVADIP